MKKICRVSGLEFEVAPQDEAFYKKMGVPIPDISPEEILRNAMTFRNERKLYLRSCSSSGERLISAYDTNVDFPVYSNELWWSDSWSGIDYGLELDNTQEFFSQLKTLQSTVPREGTSVFNSQNCDYNGHIRGSKNCYLCALVIDNEDCLYSYWTVRNRDVVDCFFTLDSQLCYECIKSKNCYECIDLHESRDCKQCFFSYHLEECSNCIFCSNLQGKQYHIFNKPVSKEVFETYKKKILNGEYDQSQKNFVEFEKQRLANPHRSVFNINCENSVGDSLQNCKDCYKCFIGEGSEDCRYCVSLNFSKDIHSSYGVNTPGENELVYSSCVVRGSQNILCSYYIWNSARLAYCDSCVACKDCFGCIGLKNKQYCILNKQYSKQEYMALTANIIAHMQKQNTWGTLPKMLSTFAYNESPAHEYFPLTQDEVKSLGYHWKTESSDANYIGSRYDIPNGISEVDESILKEILTCEHCDKNYRIILPELKFYKRLQLPIPRNCPNCRHDKRMNIRDSSKLFQRHCYSCKLEIQTTYPSGRSEKVYCETCYNKEMY